MVQQTIAHEPRTQQVPEGPQLTNTLSPQRVILHLRSGSSDTKSDTAIGVQLRPTAHECGQVIVL